MSAAVAAIVASLALNGQASAVAPTELFTPAADGVFRLNFYVGTRSMATAPVSPRVNYTDDGQAQTVTFDSTGSSNGFGNGTSTSGSLFFKGKAGQPIQVSTTLLAGAAPTYDVYFTLEAL